MHWQTILLEFCAISLLWATPVFSCVDLKLCRADILVDVRLDTIMRHAAVPPYEELLQIGVTHLGTQIDSRFLNDTVMANALRRWVLKVHANGLLTYASIREGNLALLLAVSGQALALGFDEIEFDELLSSHSMPTKQVLGAIVDLRKAHPSVTITLTEYARDSIRSLFRMLSRIPNIRIAIDVYNNLTAVSDLSKISPSAERLGAWTLIVNDTNADSYDNLLTWIITIRRLGYDLYLFTIDPSGGWKERWSLVKYALTTPLSCFANSPIFPEEFHRAITSNIPKATHGELTH